MLLLSTIKALFMANIFSVLSLALTFLGLIVIYFFGFDIPEEWVMLITWAFTLSILATGIAGIVIRYTIERWEDDEMQVYSLMGIIPAMLLLLSLMYLIF